MICPQVTVDAQGKYMAVSDDAGEVKVFDLAEGKTMRKFRSKHSNVCCQLHFSLFF